MLSVDRVTLAGTSIETLFYGVNIVLYTMSTYLLAKRNKAESFRERKSSRWYMTRNSFLVSPMFITTTIMFLCITAHWMIDIYALFQGFIDLQGVTTSAKYFNDWARRPEVWKVAFMNVALLFGDALMIYRTWIVWNNSIWAIAFPLLTLLGALVCYIGVIVQFTRIPSDGTAWFVANVLPWVTGDCVFTICVNVYTTTMISWRIIRYNWQLKQLEDGTNSALAGSPKYLTSALALITESAIIYTIWTILFFATDERQADLEPFFNLTWAAVSAFSAFLINMRVGLGWASTSTRLPTTLMGFATNSNSEPTRSQDHHHMPEFLNFSQTRTTLVNGKASTKTDSHSELEPKKEENV